MRNNIEILDVTLRDGSHAMNHSFTEQQVRDVARGLDLAGVNYYEISHGFGIGGSKKYSDRPSEEELKMIEAAVDECKSAQAAALLVPGIGTEKGLREAEKAGIKMVRVATPVLEADSAAPYIALGRELGLKTAGFLMMAHTASVKQTVEQAKLLESYGAEIVYVTDTLGTMLPSDVEQRVRALRETIACEIGFHGHNNLSMAMANTIAAIDAGAKYVDGSLRGLGAGSGNTQTEVMVAVLDRLKYQTGIDLDRIVKVANGVVAPFMKQPQEITEASLLTGYSGDETKFLLYQKR